MSKISLRVLLSQVAIGRTDSLFEARAREMPRLENSLGRTRNAGRGLHRMPQVASANFPLVPLPSLLLCPYLAFCESTNNEVFRIFP